MVPKKDAKGNVTVELSAPDQRKLRAARYVLDQLAFHGREGAHHGVLGVSIRDASNTLSRLIDEKPE